MTFTHLKGPASPYTPDQTFTSGTYDVGPTTLPYFSTTLPIEQALKYLTLAEDIVFDPTEPIRFEELFQRTLDKDRSRNEIANYLQTAERPKFFNSFTVVLLPVNRSGQGVTVLSEYGDHDDNAPPPPDDGLNNIIQVGPIRLRTLEEGDITVGRIAWNTDQIRAVIIDGQHRWYALNSLLDPDSHFPHKEQLRQSEIPLLLLILDERLGFRPGIGITNKVIGTCRSVFIDLNQHARPVSRTRNLLLDDTDITPVSMRAILEQEVGHRTTTASTASTDWARRLPLALVDWHSEQAKFDSGPYLSTVLTLADVVDSVLNIKEPGPTEYDNLKDYVVQLSERVQLDSKSDSGITQRSILRRVESAERDQLPFDFTQAEAAALGESFRESVGHIAVQILQRLSPYRTLIEGYRKAGVFGDLTEKWLALNRNGQLALEKSYPDQDFDQHVRTVWEPVKSQCELGYQVVFQKAFVRAAVMMDDVADELLLEWDAAEGDEQVGDPRTRQRFLDAFVSRFNEVFTNSLDRNSRAWNGTGIKLDGSIDFSQSSIQSIAAFVAIALRTDIVWELSQKLAEGDESSAQRRATSWTRREWEDTIRSGRPPTPFAGFSSQVTKMWRNAMQKFARQQLRSEDPAKEHTQDAIDKRARENGGRQLLYLAQRLST